MEADDGALEFACYLGTKLGKTLAELDEMSGHELAVWAVYYGRKAQRQQIEEAQARARRR